jgi:hypothetical protein
MIAFFMAKVRVAISLQLSTLAGFFGLLTAAG